MPEKAGFSTDECLVIQWLRGCGERSHWNIRSTSPSAVEKRLAAMTSSGRRHSSQSALPRWLGSTDVLIGGQSHALTGQAFCPPETMRTRWTSGNISPTPMAAPKPTSVSMPSQFMTHEPQGPRRLVLGQRYRADGVQHMRLQQGQQLVGFRLNVFRLCRTRKPQEGEPGRFGVA